MMWRGIRRWWSNLTGRHRLTTKYIDLYFVRKNVCVRKRGRHYHPDPHCGMLRSAPADDPYFLTVFQLDESDRPDLRNSYDQPYSPCGCAARVIQDSR